MLNSLVLATALVGQTAINLDQPIPFERLPSLQQDITQIVRDWKGFEDLDPQGRPRKWSFFASSGMPDRALSTFRPLPRTLGGDMPSEPVTIGGDFWIGPWLRHLNKNGYASGGDGAKFYSTGWRNPIAHSMMKHPGQSGPFFTRPDESVKSWAFSDAFPLNNEVLSILIGGQRQESNLQVEVWVQGATSSLPVGSHGPNMAGYGLVHRFLGNNAEQMTVQHWTIPAEHRNKNAKVFIVDMSTTGHLNVDAVTLNKATSRPTFILNPGLLRPVPGLKVTPPPIFGWADLHSHPIAHISSGGRFVTGSMGDVYSSGVANEEASFARDMADCDGGGHGSNGLENWIAQMMKGTTIRAEVYAKFSLGKHKHGPNGYPEFGDWPHCQDPNHQQMHINFIRRAYEGGQRLMVAAVIENQVAKYFLDTHFRESPAPRYVSNPTAEFEACVAQAREVRRIVGLNSSWMGIATSPADVRRLAAENKLAVVLAVETDQITSVAQLEGLYDAGVRVFTVVHLIDNGFGGAAAYSPLFNSMNNLCIPARFFNVVEGDTPEIGVKYRFERDDLQQLTYGYLGSLMVPTGTSPNDYTRGVWDREYSGFRAHVNALGLTELGRSAIRSLARRGAVVDIAHMGHQTVEDTLQFCRELTPGDANGYPVAYTHGGVRPCGMPGASERSLHPDHLRSMYAAKGVFGVGTSGGSASLLSTIKILRGVNPDIGISLGSDFNGGDLNAERRPSGEKVAYLNAQKRISTGIDFRQPLAEQRRSFPQRGMVPGGAGRRWFNINQDGLAQYGLMPDFLQETWVNGTSDHEMRMMLNGVESFVQMWERCESLSRGIR